MWMAERTEHNLIAKPAQAAKLSLEFLWIYFIYQLLFIKWSYSWKQCISSIQWFSKRNCVYYIILFVILKFKFCVWYYFSNKASFYDADLATLRTITKAQCGVWFYKAGMKIKFSQSFPTPKLMQQILSYYSGSGLRENSALITSPFWFCCQLAEQTPLN